jgi:hypothetical protein
MMAFVYVQTTLLGHLRYSRLMEDIVDGGHRYNLLCRRPELACTQWWTWSPCATGGFPASQRDKRPLRMGFEQLGICTVI